MSILSPSVSKTADTGHSLRGELDDALAQLHETITDINARREQRANVVSSSIAALQAEQAELDELARTTVSVESAKS